MKPKKIPMRMCVGCREMKEKRTLIRIVRTPEGNVELDPTGKKSGRGAYVCRRAECLRRSIRQKQLDRQLEITMTPEITEVLTAEMEKLSASGSAPELTNRNCRECLGLQCAQDRLRPVCTHAGL